MKFDDDSMEFDDDSIEFDNDSMEFISLFNFELEFEFEVFFPLRTLFDSWYTSAGRCTQHNRNLRHNNPK